MVDLSPSAISRKARTKGGVVTIVTVFGLVASIGLTWLGLSVNDHVAANYDASSWVWSTVQGELARVNGLTGRVDTRQALPNAKGHTVQLSQSDRYLILRDLSTGKVNAFDPATLAVTSTMDTQQGLGISIALHNESAFIIDAAQGVVRQLDPATLQPVGDPLRFPPGITGGVFDGKGKLWIAVPSEGTVTAITPAPPANARGGQGGGAGPVQVRTDPVAEPWHDLALSALDDGVAILDQTNGKLSVLRGDKLITITTDGAGGELPPFSSGDAVPVTVVEGRHVYVVSGSGDALKVTDFTVPGEGRLQPAVAWAGRIYIADDTNGKVYSLDREGKLVNTITFRVPGPLQLEVRENHLFINSPGSSTAHVVNDKHEDKEVDKFKDDVTGGKPPVVPPQEQKPVITKPGAPRSIKAAAGDNQVTLTWNKAPDNGSKIIKYVVTGNGQTTEVGANQRSLVITGLVNGTEYEFLVRAVNGQGEGPNGRSNKVIPTRDVPDAPTDVKAEARPDGTVAVTWTAANGQGRKIVRYEVTAISAGAGAPIGANNGETTLVIPDKELPYGTQVAFTVVTINDIGGGSKASTPVSNSVVPYNKPSAVRNLAGAPVGSAQGSVRATWAAAAENGRPITGYKVTAKGRTTEVTGTSATLNGFADGEIVTIEVVAVNAAGDGPKATTSARTIIAPTVTNVTRETPDYHQVRIHFEITDGGGAATCDLLVNGAARGIPCSAGGGGYLLTGLYADLQYTFAVKITNPTGSDQSANQSFQTKTMNGRVTCINTNAHGDPTYCNDGIGVYERPRQQSGESVGATYNGNRFQALCWAQGQAGNQSGDAVLNPVQYNAAHPQSALWIKIPFGGENYIPWIWFNLDDYDSESGVKATLRQC